MKRKGLTMAGRSRLTGLLFFSPWLVGFLALTLYPLLYSVVIGFSEVRIKVTGTELRFLGLEHYAYALTRDENFPIELLTSIAQIAAGLPIVLVFSLIVALLLNRRFRGRAFFRAVFFLPVVIISGPVLTQLVEETKAMQITFDMGFLRYFSRGGGPGLAPIMQQLVRTLWFSGVQTLIFLAALQKIDHSIYEAASIDGATGWEMFWRITLPYVKPTILLNAIYTVVEMGAVSSDPTNVRIMDHLLEVGRPYSYSAAMAWIFALLQLAIILIAFLLLRQRRGKGERA
ncbi:MAG: sugar ABC transporter permease [Oscillospiraceae bacterium]|nr:sugar ABC transporter permease [Oscillospiraceae bacterium]